MNQLLTIGACLFLLCASSAVAETYRCDGYVQFRPCDQKSGLGEEFAEKPRIHTQGDNQAQRVRARKVHWNSNSNSKILKQNFRRYSPREGLWSGRLLGNGMVHLTLQIFKEGQLVSSRYMGKVLLKPEDQDISFNFRAPLPQGEWSWKIVTT